MAKTVTITLEADSKGAVRTIKKVQGELVKVGDASEEAGNDLRQSFTDLRRRSGLAEVQLEQLEVQAMDTAAAARKMAGTGSTASQVLFDLGQTGQDAAYGIRFAANNAPILIQNFQRLITQAGGLRAALGALTSSIFGLSGIIAVISLIPLITQLFDFGDAAEEASTKTEGMNENLSESEKRMKALREEASKITSEMLSFAGKVPGFEDIAPEQLPKFVQAAKERRDNLQETVKARRKELEMLQKVTAETTTASQRTQLLLDLGIDSKEQAEQRIPVVQAILRAKEGLLAVAQETTTSLEEQLDKYRDQSEQARFLDSLGVERKKTQEEITTEMKEQEQALSAVGSQWQMMLGFMDDAVVKASLLAAKVSPDAIRPGDLMSPSGRRFEQIQKEFEKERKKSGQISKGFMAQDVQDRVGQAVQWLERYRQKTDEAKKSQDALAQGARAAASAIASSAVAAAQASENRAQAIGNAARSAIRAFMAEAIAAAISDAIKTTGPFAIAAAPAAAALVSGAFEALIPSFASGGVMPFDGVARVGERGPEMVHLPKGAKVTPNHQLGSMRTPTAAEGELVSEVRKMRREMQNLERVMPVSEYESERKRFNNRRQGVGGS